VPPLGCAVRWCTVTSRVNRPCSRRSSWGTSTALLAGGHAVFDRNPDPQSAIADLVAFHVEFSVSRSDVIPTQDRDLDKLSATDQHTVRAAQRAYVDPWVGILQGVHPDENVGSLRTPHSAS
jgi:hypothetical protein